MKKYIQYLVGSQKIQYVQQSPQLLQKKYILENLKNQSCLVLNSNEELENKLKIISGTYGSFNIPTVKVDLMSGDCFVLEYTSQIAFIDKDGIVQKINNYISDVNIEKKLRDEVIKFFSTSEYSSLKTKNFILFPSEWFSFIKKLRPKGKDVLSPNHKSKERIEVTDVSEFEISVPSQTVFGYEPIEHQTQSTVVINVKFVSKLSFDNELFRKPCFSFFIPNSSALYIVTSIGIEALELPDIGSYLMATRFEGNTPTPKEMKEIQSTSSIQSPTNSQNLTPEKKNQRIIWTTIHTDLTHSSVDDLYKRISLHICACLVPDRNAVACGDSDGYIRIYSLEQRGKLMFTLPSESLESKISSSIDLILNSSHNGPVVDLSYSSIEDILISGGIDGTCRVWSLKHKNLLKIIVPPQLSALYSRIQNSEIQDKTIGILLPPPASNIKEVSDIKVFPVTTIDIDQRLNVLTVGYLSGEVSQYKIDSGERILAIGNNKESQIVKSLSVLSQSQFIAFSNEKQIVRVWDILLEREHSRFNCNASQKFLYSSRKDILFICTENGEIQFWKGIVLEILKRERDLKLIYTLKLHTTSISSVWYHSDFDVLITMSSNGQIAITLDAVSDALSQVDGIIKTKVFTSFMDYDLQLSNYNDKLKNSLIEELNLSNDSFIKNVSTDLVQENSIPDHLSLTKKEIETFTLILENLKMQLKLQPNNEKLKLAILTIENDSFQLQKRLIQEFIESKEFLSQNHQSLKDKFGDCIDPVRVSQTDAAMISTFKSEIEEMKERHKKEMEELESKHAKEMSEYIQKKDQESTKAAKAYFAVKQAYNEMLHSLDIEGANLYKTILSKLDICPVQHFRGLDPERYKILSLIGEDSNRSFQAISFQKQKLVAIKALPPGIQLIDYLEHKRLVPVYEILCTDSHTFVVMEKMHTNLSQYLRNDGGFLKKHIIQQIVYDLLCALEYLHEQGMVHREIRPENIYLDESLRAYVKHFGIMKDLSFENENPENNVWFSAPEIFMSSIYLASDIWSVGIIFGYLLQTEQERQDVPLIKGTDPVSILQDIIELSNANEEDLKSLDNNSLLTGLTISQKENPFIERISCASEIEISLLKSMLKFNPKKRATILTLKEHSYFKSIRMNQ